MAELYKGVPADVQFVWASTMQAAWVFPVPMHGATRGVIQAGAPAVIFGVMQAGAPAIISGVMQAWAPAWINGVMQAGAPAMTFGVTQATMPGAPPSCVRVFLYL